MLKSILLAAAASSAVAAGTAFAQSSESVWPEAVVTRSLDDAPASFARSASTPAERIKAYLAARGEIDAATDLELVTSHTSKFGRLHQIFQQRIEGRRVYGAVVKANFDETSTLLKLFRRVQARKGQTLDKPTITAEEALAIVVARHFPNAPTVSPTGSEGTVTTFSEAPFFYTPPSVEEVLISRGARLVSGFEVTVWSADTNELYKTLVGPAGRILNIEDRTANDTYAIFADHPGVSPQTVVSGPGAGNVESPNGWLGPVSQFEYSIQGNNVHAYLDRDNSNSPDAGGTEITTGDFVAGADLTLDPTDAVNQAVAVQNLFYFNNVIHDRLYRHGFVEGAANFQEDNFGLGGAGSDSVNAEAQDGGGVNNANFATPGDGFNPRMQMYLWNRSSPWRDGDLDSDIIWHEYGHGLTWRMIGSMSGSVSGAIGEGMSDVLSILINDNDVVGEYSVNDTRGIRSAAYTNYPRTIGDFSGRSVHFDGEIYAATIWALKGLFEDDGLSVDTLLDTIVEGMNFTAPGPTYLDMRDGLLDAAPEAQDCLVWEAFAQYGMGDGAIFESTFFSVNIEESFDLPVACGGGEDLPRVTDITVDSVFLNNWVWQAEAAVTVEDPEGVPLEDVLVVGDWRGKTSSCRTDLAGQCTIVANFFRWVPSVDFTVQSLDRQPVAGDVLTASVSRP